MLPRDLAKKKASPFGAGFVTGETVLPELRWFVLVFIVLVVFIVFVIPLVSALFLTAILRRPGFWTRHIAFSRWRRCRAVFLPPLAHIRAVLLFSRRLLAVFRSP